jgi:hypothetical protein
MKDSQPYKMLLGQYFKQFCLDIMKKAPLPEQKGLLLVEPKFYLFAGLFDVLPLVVLPVVVFEWVEFVVEPEFVLPVFDVDVEFVFDIVVFAAAGVGVAVAFTVARFVLVFAAVLVFAVSPQAIPKAPNAKTVESAITFLIILLSFSKCKFLSF